MHDPPETIPADETETSAGAISERILIVDDEPDIRNLLSFALKAEGYAVAVAEDGARALSRFREGRFGVVLTDLKMPVMDGMSLLNELKTADPDVEVIVLTGHATVEKAVAALKTGGAFDFLQKPLEEVDQMLATVARALERRRLRFENRRMVAELRKLSRVVRQSPSITMIADAKGMVEYVNPKFTEVTGFPPEAVVGRQIDAFNAVNPDEVDPYVADRNDALRASMWRTIITGAAWRGELISRRKTGKPYWEMVSVSSLKDDAGDITHFVKVAEDITGRKAAEQSLRESERFSGEVLDALPMNVLVLDPNGVIRRSNDAWRRFAARYFGDDLTGSAYGDILERMIAASRDPTSPTSIDPRGEACRRFCRGFHGVLHGAMHRFEMEMAFPLPGDQTWFLMQVCRLETAGRHIIIVQTDITPLKRMEARVHQSRKMEAVARLAGGIAHEFQNALSGMIGYIDLLEMDMAEGIPVNPEYLENINTISRRMSALSNKLVAYAEGGDYLSRNEDLREIVASALPRQIDGKLQDRPGIFVNVSQCKTPATVFVDATQFRIVVSALVENAAEAINDHGRIDISVSRFTTGPMETETGPMEHGEYICLSVSDDGIGMDETVKRRIFEPFFSTKFMGRGLSMAAVHGIVKNHGGGITVDSEPDGGTTVRVYLPAVAEAAAP